MLYTVELRGRFWSLAKRLSDERNEGGSYEAVCGCKDKRFLRLRKIFFHFYSITADIPLSSNPVHIGSNFS